MPRCRSPAARCTPPGRSRRAAATLDQRRALLCLTQAVYYEAGFEPLEGRRAVAQVVLNRMRHPAFPKSVCGVVYQERRRASASSPSSATARFIAARRLARWRQAEQVARAALAGYVETAVGEATHYHADYVAPRWAPLLAKVAQIGQHIFYRWPGAWGQPAAFTGRYIGEPRDPLSMRPPPPTHRIARRPARSGAGPVTDGTVRPARAPRRRRRPARHVEGLDAQHSGPGRQRQRRSEADRVARAQAGADADSGRGGRCAGRQVASR